MPSYIHDHKATRLPCGLTMAIHAGVSGRANVNSIRKARGVLIAEAASCDLDGYSDVT